MRQIKIQPKENYRMQNVTRKLLLGLVLVCIPTWAGFVYASGPVVGYGSSDAVLPAKTQELFFAGFDLGLKDHLRRKIPQGFLLVNQISDGNKLSAIRSAKALLDANVKMIVGFPTSHEALLAAEIAQKNGVLAILAGAGHSKLAEMGRTVFTTGETMDSGMESVLDLALERFPGKRGLMIINRNAVFSTNQKTVLERLLKLQKYSGISAEYADLDASGKLTDETIAHIKRNQPDYYFFTPYADESMASLDQIVQSGIDRPILSNSSWTAADIDF